MKEIVELEKFDFVINLKRFGMSGILIIAFSVFDEELIFLN
jgi:hypothetical protein